MMTWQNKPLLRHALVMLGSVLFFGVFLFVPCSSVVPNSDPQIEASVDAGCSEASCHYPPLTQTFIQDDWQFTTPDHNWTVLPIKNSSIQLALITNEPPNLLLLFGKSSLDDKATLADSAIDIIRTFAVDNYLITLVKQSVIHDQKFVLAQVNKGNRVIWLWMTTKGKASYLFTCGGEMDVDAGSLAQHDMCDTIAESIVIQ